MVRSSALRLAAIAAAVTLTPVLAGCAAGLNAQTNVPYATTDGASAVFRGIAIRNVFVLGPSDTGGALQPGQSASLFLALVNDGAPDRLAAVSAPGTASSVAIHGNGVNLPAGQVALLTGPQPQLVLRGLQRPLRGGTDIAVTLVFQNAGAISLSVPVMPRSQYYATFAPPPPPVSSPTRTASPRPARSASAGATPSPSPSSTP